MTAIRYRLDDHPALDAAADAAVAQLATLDAVARLWAHDFTLFSDDPTEIENRLGWLEVASDSLQRWPALEAQAGAVAQWATDVVVMGMGGSSLFPEVLATTFGRCDGFPQLHVLDSTDPAAVRRMLDATDPATTFCVAASKSGSTVETRSHLATFWDRNPDPSRFGVITDPGSALGDWARSVGIDAIWENDPDIGGRFSALSMFGMVPAALAGVDGEAILEAALDLADALDPSDEDAEANLGLRLGGVFAGAALAGFDKLTILVEPSIASFGLWLEQLVAESTGKLGRGIVPIVGADVAEVLSTPAGRLVVTIGAVAGIGELRESGLPMVEMSFDEPVDLGAQVLLWETAVALTGPVLGINPFDQPDVEAAKVAARAVLAGEGPAAVDVVSVESLLSTVAEGDYVAVCAFVDPASPVVGRLEEARRRLGVECGVAATLNIGPRFLHSSGQLHKGGPGSIVVVQVLETVGDDLAIPGESFTFGELKAAQAAGDLVALQAAGHRAGRVRLDDLLASQS